jgi:hypothetical protein
MSSRSRAVLVVALGVAALHAWRLGEWLVDDAGITFAYARNLAFGAGLVSQPGVPPLEGFSNPLWTLLLAPFFTFGLFDAVWTPKILSFALVAAAMVVLVRQVEHRGVAAVLAASAVALLAADTSFVVWSMSGLENALLALLLVISASLSLKAGGEGGARYDRVAGVVAGLLALTRPDALVYAAAYPAAVCLAHRDRVADLVRRMVPYGLNVASVFGSYLIFRRAYFGDWVPNTYHAKVRPWMMSVDPDRLRELVESAVGRWMWPALAVMALAATAALLGRASRRVAILAVYLGLASFAYLALPPDWMGEYRFATGFFIFFYWMLGEALAWLWDSAHRYRRWLAAATALLIAGESATVHAARTEAFAGRPTVPFARIAEFADGYDQLSAALGPGPYSLLTPDLGGMLFRSRLRIYDLAGLCDATIARTLMDDGPAFRDYVFETTRPTFIHIHGSWADWASLHADGRFARDYVVLHETWERPRGADASKGEPWAGDYVRRDAASATTIERVRHELHRLGLDRPLP